MYVVATCNNEYKTGKMPLLVHDRRPPDKMASLKSVFEIRLRLTEMEAEEKRKEGSSSGYDGACKDVDLRQAKTNGNVRNGTKLPKWRSKEKPHYIPDPKKP